MAHEGLGKSIPGELLADAECVEDPVENVVGGGGPGKGIEGAETGVEIQQQHLVGKPGKFRIHTLGEGICRFP